MTLPRSFNFCLCLSWWRLATLGLFIGLSPLGALAGNEAGFRGDAAHSGVFHSAAASHLTLKWTFQTGEAIVSSPTVAGDTAYVGSSDIFSTPLTLDPGS